MFLDFTGLWKIFVCQLLAFSALLGKSGILILCKDIITKVKGVEVGAAGSLANLIGEYKPGDTVPLTVVREGKEIAINVTLEGYPD